MDDINFIQDLAIVLLAAGLAGVICKRLGLSVIVGYLAAGIVIGPHTPPFSFVNDVARITTLSQLGLVFLMFAIGLGLSLTKLGKMGVPTLVATGLGAFFMLNLTELVGAGVGWTGTQTLFVASMFMVSSSAVIAKVVSELNLGHERFAQRALAVTVLEDVVAVVMLTVLASQVPAATAGGTTNGVGGLLTTLSAFVVLLVAAGLLLVPRLLRRLEAKADPEIQTIVVAGVLFILAISAAKAGYSLALGAFLLGAIVAEMPQRVGVERSFAGMRDVFSSVFFVSIGMMIEVRLLLDVWPWILGLWAFAMIARPLATGLALLLVGTAPAEARRGGLLLAPLGEFSFIIAKLGVDAKVLPATFYPLAVGVSILSVLAMPFVNRHAEAIVGTIGKVEPRWLVRAMEAYHGWLQQVQSRPAPPLAWKLVKGRLVQIGLELLFVTGVLSFSAPILAVIERTLGPGNFDATVLNYVFWGAVGVIVLIPLVAIWRNVSAIALIGAESLGAGSKLTPAFVENGLKAIAGVALGYWLYAALPIDALPLWGWVVIAGAALGVVVFFSQRLVYWHSSMQSSMREVLAEDPRGAAGVRADARVVMDRSLKAWQLHLEECIVPDTAVYAGQTLATLSIPARFGCSVIEVERNGYVITATGPELRLYPGDKLLLLGEERQLDAARTFLKAVRPPSTGEGDEFSGSVLETHTLPDGDFAGKTLAELQLARVTGVRVAGIQRGAEQIINPSGAAVLQPGDSLLIVGTLAELRAFRQWLAATAAGAAQPAAT